MPDKKYKELKVRLDQKRKPGGNFRPYEKMRQDVKANDHKTRPRVEAPSVVREKKRGKSSPAARNYFLESISKAVIPFIVVIFTIILFVYLLTNKNATEISVNDEVIGQLKPANIAAEDFLKTLTAKIEQIEETKIKITDDITLVPVHGKSKLLMDDSELLNMMADIVNYEVQASKITVDGVEIGIAKNYEEAQSIFNAVMAPYITDNENTTAEFVQDVLATEIYVTEDKIDSNDFIRSELSKTNSVNTEYEVVSGDTLSKIAATNGITINDIKDSNPGLDVTKPLQVGQKLNISSTVPFVSVMTIETKTEESEIPMPVDEQPDSSLPKGKTRIVKQGKPGKKESVTQIIRVNGIITSQGDVSENIKEPAETQIVSVGTG